MRRLSSAITTAIGNRLPQKPEQFIRATRRPRLYDLPVFGRDAVNVFPIHRNAALRIKMNRRLVLTEADLLHLQVLEERKAYGLFESMHIDAYELSQNTKWPHAPRPPNSFTPDMWI